MNKTLLVFTLLLAIVALWSTCSLSKKNDEYAMLEKAVSEYKLKEKEFTVKVQKDSSKIAEQSQTILTQKQAIESGLLDMGNRMKKIESQLQAKIGIRIVDKPIPFIPKNYADTTGLVKDENGVVIRQDSIAVPASVGINEKEFYFEGTITKKGFVIDSANVPIKLNYTIGTQKQGFLKKAKPIVYLKMDNKYATIEGLSNIVVSEPKRRFWKVARIAIPLLIGGYAGYKLAK